MANYLQIGDDPTKWWLVQPFDASQLTGQPLYLVVGAPLGGILLLSGKPASVAVFDEPDATFPPVLNPSVGAIYLPTATGASAAQFGYTLPPTANVEDLASEIAAAMRNGTRQTITLDGGGTLVLNGATLSFVIIQPGEVPQRGAPAPVHDSTPHG